MTTTLLFFTSGGNASLASLPTLGFVLQIAALFSAIGALLVQRAEIRGWAIDRAEITTAWSLLGFVLAVLAVFADAVA